MSELTAAIESTFDPILVKAGTYNLTSDMCSSETPNVGASAICINRTVTIKAEVPGGVVINAMNARRVIRVSSGGVAKLIGLDVTGGMAGSVCSPF